MSKQYHFVVVYDTDLKEWSVEPDVSMNFDSGDVWNNETQEWEFNTCDTKEQVAITDAIAKIMREAPSVEISN
jgi:starvation-inducible outer membrane lipoprotein